MIRATRVGTLLATGLAMTLLTVGIGLSAASAGASPASKSKNWIIKVANLASASPNFAYPYVDPGDFSVTNVSDFQYLMYRPLYWFGNTQGTQAVEPNLKQSLAALPKMSNNNRTATIILKAGYKWSNGAPVQAKDIMQWLNLMAAYPSAYGNYSPPVNGVSTNIPDIIKSASITNARTIVLNLNTSVSSHWLLYNPLSEISPLPQAWDVMAANWSPGASTTAANWASSAGGSPSTVPGGCWSSTFIGNGNNVGPTATFKDPNGYLTVVPASKIAQAKRCQEVIATMTSFANDVVNYAKSSTTTGKLWGISDGPWKLKTYNNATAAMSWVHNPRYGGVPALAKALDYIPCQSVTGDCYNLLLSNQLSAGGLPTSFAPTITALSQAKYAQVPQLGTNYHLQVGNSWAIGYNMIGFNSTLTGAAISSSAAGDTTPHTALFAQGYIAKALNDSYPGQTIDNNVYRGYYYPIFGPIPPLPKNNFTSLTTSPFSLADVATTLGAHGWTMVNGVYTCTSPGAASGHCGANIAHGATMTFRVDAYTQGSITAETALDTWVSAAATVGIKLVKNLFGTFGALIGGDTNATSNWDISDYGGWSYGPGYYPSGEPLFLTGAASNAGNYSNATNDKNIIGTLKGTVSLDAYERYLADNPPAVWTSWRVALREVSNKVGGDFNEATSNINPELWYLK